MDDVPGVQPPINRLERKECDCQGRHMGDARFVSCRRCKEMGRRVDCTGSLVDPVMKRLETVAGGSYLDLHLDNSSDKMVLVIR